MQTYFLTYGRGLDSIVLNELERLVQSLKDQQLESYELCVQNKQIEGKLFFSSNVPLSALLGLKTAERLFFSIVSKSFCEHDQPVGEHELLTWIADQFDFDFKAYNPYQFEQEQERNDFDSSKRVCRSFRFRVDCRMTGLVNNCDFCKILLCILDYPKFL